ncbi:hypothetical protein J6357_29170, partial [Burkholderia pseudomallei]|nr:hypothetical protein [Burkholderia pseudomallei]MBO7872881.1 hypothetical protein [Burkholderia pseudomallei]
MRFRSRNTRRSPSGYGRSRGRAIVSLNDHPEIRRVFAGFHIESVPIQYTVGGAKGVERRERIT